MSARGAICHTGGEESQQADSPGRVRSSGARGDCLGSDLTFRLTRQSWEEGVLEWEVTKIPKAHQFRVTLNMPYSIAPALVDRQIEIDKPGKYSVEIPKTNIEAGRYRWTVQAICNEQKPSHNLVAWMLIDVDESAAMDASSN